MSVTTDRWTAYQYSAGWNVKGTILEIDYGGPARPAGLKPPPALP